MKFYTVTANFDMSAHSELVVKSFLSFSNALECAEEQRNEFLNCISGGELDPEASDFEADGDYYYYYGVSKNGEDFVTIRVTSTLFAEEEQLLNRKHVRHLIELFWSQETDDQVIENTMNYLHKVDKVELPGELLNHIDLMEKRFTEYYHNLTTGEILDPYGDTLQKLDSEYYEQKEKENQS